MKKIAITMLVLFIWLWPVLALAAELSLGVSERGNRNQAVSQAGKRAQAQVLMQKAGKELTPEQLAANWPRFSLEVFDNPFPYIKSFRTLMISQQDEQTWVLVEVEINDAAFQYLLNGMRGNTTRVESERILCLVPEAAAPGRPAVYWWSGQPGVAACPLSLTRALQQLRYAPVDPSAIISALQPAIRNNSMLSQEQAIALGAEAGSKLVLWGGTGGASPGPPLLQLALLEVESKRLLARTEVEGADLENMNQQALKAVTRLFELAGIAVEAPPQTQVIVEIQGISSSGELGRLERLLTSMDGLVTSVRREGLSLGKGTFLVNTTEDGMALADALEKADEAGWRIKILERTPTRLRVTPVLMVSPRSLY